MSVHGAREGSARTGLQPGPGESAVQFGILGSLRVAVGGREVRLDSPKQRSLLAALLIDVGSVVSTDRLVEFLWAGDQPDHPSGAVQTLVSRLRRELTKWCGVPVGDVLVTRPPGYVLTLPADRVDAGRFQRLVDDARRSRTPRERIDLTGAALALWRGPPLFEFDHERANAEAARLGELQRAAFELRADAMLRCGWYTEVVAELEGPVSANPLNEGLRGQLMVALYRCGRQAEALAAYRELRDELAGELGLEPSAALRNLEVAILQQAEQLPWPAPPIEADAAEDRARHARESGTTTLPSEVPTSFVGRDEDIRRVTAALANKRMVVLTGVGGVGKSRLAVRVARGLGEKYTDGVKLCDLAGAGGSAAVPNVVASALGMLPARYGSAADGLVEVLHAQRVLLVLDNCEHVLVGVSDLMDRIGRGCPEVDVLVTSRQPPTVVGQQIWPVEPLEIGDGIDGAAVELFCDRAAAADPSFELSDVNEAAVAEVCRRLDGVPLAVELAAARVRSMTPGDLAERLDHRFNLLTTEAPMVSPRHRSLQAVLDWSSVLLPDRTRLLLDRLAVFAGGFELDAVEAVCAGDGLQEREVAGRLAELVDHSLVVLDGALDRSRYRLLETIRAWGIARLKEGGELSRWQRRHAEHYCAVAAGAVGGLVGSEEAVWVAVIDREFANLRTAHAWACESAEVEMALRLPAFLRTYAYYRLVDEVFRWAERALELPGAASHAAYSGARVAVGVGCVQRGELTQAHDHGEDVAGAPVDDQIALRIQQLRAEVALYQGRLDDTARCGRELVGNARSIGDSYYEALGHLYCVHAAAYSGREEDVDAHLEAGWRAVRGSRNPTLRAGFSYLEGEIRLDDHPDVARASLQQAVESARTVRNRFLEGVARVALASLEARHGQPDEALTAFREIIDHWRRCGDWVHMWTTLHHLPVLLERAGEHQLRDLVLQGSQHGLVPLEWLTWWLSAVLQLRPLVGCVGSALWTSFQHVVQRPRRDPTELPEAGLFEDLTDRSGAGLPPERVSDLL